MATAERTNLRKMITRWHGAIAEISKFTEIEVELRVQAVAQIKTRLAELSSILIQVQYEKDMEEKVEPTAAIEADFKSNEPYVSKTE